MYLAPLQVVVADGESIDVDETVGESLIAQGWKPKVLKRPLTIKADVADSQEIQHGPNRS